MVNDASGDAVLTLWLEQTATRPTLPTCAPPTPTRSTTAGCGMSASTFEIYHGDTLTSDWDYPLDRRAESTANLFDLVARECAPIGFKSFDEAIGDSSTSRRM